VSDSLRIGIYGGTFNPPHIGHERSAKSAARQLGLDLLMIVPNGSPPHKTLPAGTPSAEDRLHMARCTFEDSSSIVVSDIEIKRAFPSYTIDTVLAVKKGYPGAEIFLLMGTDMFLSLETWWDSEELLRAVTPAVFFRSAGDPGKIPGYALFLKERYGAHTEVVISDIVEISSSELRALLPERKGAGYIADTTYSYIVRNGLYGAKPDWEWLRARAHSMLDEKRIPHVVGCEGEALRLAQRWGVDLDDAREAAILHDITKKLGKEENLGILAKHGVFVGKLEQGEEKLLHSKTGAVLARSEFGVSEAVADSIMWHTTGRANMSDLEKIIYLADYIEPMRDFDGVGLLRQAAYSDIDAAMRMGLEISIEDMVSRGITPNRVTYDALDDVKA
jgi:nicotinate-nucleotide adenylyltransferase